MLIGETEKFLRLFSLIPLYTNVNKILLGSMEIKSVNPKGNQPWIFIWRADAETEAPIIWSLDAKSQLTGKDPDAGKDWG